MKTIKHTLTSILLLFLVTFSAFKVNATPILPMSGTYSIGPSPSSFTSIKNAITALTTNGVSGAVIFELKSNYVSTLETFPLTFSQVTGVSAANTITIRPESNATNLSIINNTNSSTLQFFGIDYLTIDGRPGGTGNAIQLGIISSLNSISSPVIYIYEDASYNTIEYCNIKGSTYNTTGGMIQLFRGTANVSTGCDNNTFDHNVIDGFGSNNIFYIGISAGTPIHDNTTISNNSIKNYYKSGTANISSYAINSYTGTNNTYITGNSFFQDTVRVFSASAVHGIIKIGAGNVTITDNYFGGSSANCSGNPYTLNHDANTVATQFSVMDLTVSTTTNSIIQNNVIQNFNVTTGATSSNVDFVGISISGKATISNNTIGSITSNNSIVIRNTSSTTAGAIYGILCSNAGDLVIDSNKIGGITDSGVVSNNVYGTVAGIFILKSAGNIDVTNNTVGSNTLANNINITNGVSSSTFIIYGIYCSNSGGTATINNINNNIISNINHNPLSASAGALMVGLYISFSNPDITCAVNNNVIKNLSCLSNRTTSPSLTGLSFQNSTTSAITKVININSNTISNLVNNTTSNSSAVIVTGINIVGNTLNTLKANCNSNTVFGLNYPNTTGGTKIYGISVDKLATSLVNNVIRLGVDGNGNASTSDVSIFGINKTANNGNLKILHNTVYIDGAVAASGSSITGALFYGSNITTDTILNNIFINKRTNPTASVSHFGIITSGNYYGNAKNYNVYYTDAISGAVGYKTSNLSTYSLSAWKALDNADKKSKFNDVSFTNVNGDATTFSLLPTTGNFIRGTNMSNIATDILGVARITPRPSSGAYEVTVTCNDISSTQNLSICPSALPYTWQGKTLSAAGSLIDTLESYTGCDSVITLNLTLKQVSAPTTVNTSICPGVSYTFNGVSYTTAGSHTATFSNAAGCDSVVTVNITLSTPTTPSISIAPSANNVCLGAAITFTAAPVNGGASPSFVWKKNGVIIGGATSSTYTFIAGTLANNDTVSSEMTANNACQTTAIANSNKIGMILKSGPAIGTSTGGTICTIGGTLTIYNTNTQGGGVWSSNDTTIAKVNTVGGANGAVVATGAGTATMTYTKTSTSNGCKAVALAVVTVAPVAAPSPIGGATSVCKGATTTLTNATPNGVWKSLTTSTATIDSVTGVATGVYQGTATIRYTVKNAYGCSNFATLSLPVSNIPSVPTINYATGTGNQQVGPNSSFCVNDTFSVVGKVSPVVAGTGAWSSSNPAAVTISNAGLIKIVSVGTTSITYIFTSSVGCSNSRTVTGVKAAICPGHRGAVINNGQLTMDNDFTIYPNPARTSINFNVKTLVGSGTIVVTDLYGKQVKIQNLSMGNNTVDISNLAKGFYLVSTITEQGKTTKKLVVE